MANSPAVDKVTEAIDSAIGGFTTDTIVPDFENLMASLSQVPEALEAAIRKLAGRTDDEMAVHQDVGEALREALPLLGTLKERLDDANRIFRERHKQELDQHHAPRPGERAWNT